MKGFQLIVVLSILAYLNGCMAELTCEPTTEFANSPGIEDWCNSSCNAATPNCPGTHCDCVDYDYVDYIENPNFDEQYPPIPSRF